LGLDEEFLHGQLATGVPPADAVRQIVLFGARNRDGWGVAPPFLPRSLICYPCYRRKRPISRCSTARAASPLTAMDKRRAMSVRRSRAGSILLPSTGGCGVGQPCAIDESKLYVIEGAPEGRSIFIFDVVDGGAKLANGRIFINCDNEETPDGFRVDVDGNLWCGWGMSPALDGVKVFNPAGKAIGFIALPERAANVLLRWPLPQPAVHGGEPLDLFALCERAGRGRRVSASHLRRRSRDRFRCRPNGAHSAFQKSKNH
jgi:hypothetical protein